jgi:hypothetical protein
MVCQKFCPRKSDCPWFFSFPTGCPVLLPSFLFSLSLSLDGSLKLKRSPFKIQVTT